MMYLRVDNFKWTLYKCLCPIADLSLFLSLPWIYNDSGDLRIWCNSHSAHPRDRNASCTNQSKKSNTRRLDICRLYYGAIRICQWFLPFSRTLNTNRLFYKVGSHERFPNHFFPFFLSNSLRTKSRKIVFYEAFVSTLYGKSFKTFYFTQYAGALI